MYIYTSPIAALLLLKCNASFSKKGKTNVFWSKMLMLLNIPKQILLFHKLSIKEKISVMLLLFLSSSN